MEPVPAAPAEASPRAAAPPSALSCVVCGSSVGPDDAVCPRCDEPRVRICTCSSLVTLDVRECPGCGRVIERVLSLAERSRRRWRQRFWIGAAALVVLVPAGLLAAKWLRGARQASALRVAGERALRDGSAAEAVERLTEYLQRRPDDARARLLLAEACFERGDVEGGRAEALRALSSAPNLPGGRLLLARRLHAAGRSFAALAEARTIDDPAGRALVAEILASLGRLTEAATAYDEALRAAPESLGLRLAAAAVHERLGSVEWEGTAEHRTRAAELLDETVRLGESRLVANPGDAEAATAVARAMAATRPGADAPAAADRMERAFERAIALAPEDLALRSEVAAAFLRAGRTDAALAGLGRAPRGPASTSLWVARALLLDEAGARDRAISELRVAAAADAREPGPAVALARLHLAVGRAEEAAAALSAARSAGVRDSDDLFEVRADTAAALGDPEACRRVLADWRVANPTDPRPLRRLLDLEMPAKVATRVAALDGPERLSEARGRLEELADLDPEDRAVLLWRARWDDATGRPAEAARRVARLLELHPEDVAGRVLRVERTFTAPADARDGAPVERPAALAAELSARPGGRAPESRAFVRNALAAGMPDLAIDVAAAALERAPGDAELVSGLARALVAAGRPAAGVAAIDRAPAPVRAVPGVAAERVVAEALATRDRGAAEAAEAAAADGADRTAAGVPDAANLDALLAAGRAEALAGRRGSASAVLARARTACARRTADLRRLAEALEDADLLDEARTAWDAALDADPQDVDLLARGGVARLVPGTSAGADDRTEAAARMARLRSSSGGAAGALGLRGAFAAAQGDDSVAIADLRRALFAAPERDDLRLLLARVLLRSGALRSPGGPEVAEAAEVARRVLARRPASLRARALLTEALVVAGAAAAESGRLLTALRAAEDLAALSGERTERAPLALGAPRLPEAALARLREAVGARPDDCGHRLLLAIDAAARGADDEAEAFANAAAESRPDLAGALVVRAFLRGLAGRSDEARRDAVDARARRAPGAEVAFAEAAGLVRAQREDEALGLVSAWCHADAPARLRAAAASLQFSRPATRDAALDAFTDLLDTAPEEAAAMGLHAWGLALAESGPASVHARAARRTLRRALARAPADPAAPASREALAKLR